MTNSTIPCAKGRYVLRKLFRFVYEEFLFVDLKLKLSALHNCSLSIGV